MLKWWTFYTLEWFLDSIKAVINDKGFQLPTQPAKNARETASKLIALSQTTESQATFSAFAERLFTLLGPVFATRPNKSLKIQREQMWGAYHLLRTSPTFIQRWTSFMSSTIGDLHQDPILIQYITDQFFHRLIRCQYSLAALTYEERNALHYTVCCTLKKRL